MNAANLRKFDAVQQNWTALLRKRNGVSIMAPDVFSDCSVKYAWRILLGSDPVTPKNCLLGELERTGLKLCYSDSPVRDKQCVCILKCKANAWSDILRKVDGVLPAVQTSRVLPKSRMGTHLQGELPVLFWGAGYENGSKPFVEQVPNGSVVFYADLIAAVLFMLTRWEETVVKTRDIHGRFPAHASVAYKQGFLDRPIIDEYAMVFQSWIKAILPGWKRPYRQFQIKISHDIDAVRSSTFRHLIGDIFKRRDPKSASDTFLGLIHPPSDPFLSACYQLADLSEKCGIASAFYFMAAKKSQYNNGYKLNQPTIRKLINDLRERGHEVGFHASYESYRDEKVFLEEKSTVDQFLENIEYGGRQHYLRFSIPHTWRIWERAGLSYDSTLGYADCEGFRCGTCQSFRPFDLQENRELNLLEIPLIVMDTTLHRYKRYATTESITKLLLLAERCKAVGGIFTLLWHNTSFSQDWRVWRPVYKGIMQNLSKMSACS